MSDLNKKRSVQNLIYSSLSQVVTVLLGLILPRLYLINYGSEVNGLLNSTNQFLVYLSLFEAGVGAVTLQALYKPVVCEDRELINGILSATNHYYKKTGILYLTGLLFLSCAYPLIVDSSLNNAEIAFIVFFSGFSSVIMFFCQGKYNLLLQADGKKYILTNVSTFINVLIGIGKVILIFYGFNAVEVVIVSFFIRLFQVGYITYYINRNYKWIDLSVPPKFECISQRKYSLIHQLAGMIFQNTDLLILTFFCNLKVVSIYSVYKLVIIEIENVLNIITGSINFALGQLFHTNIERFKRIIDTFESYYSAFSFALLSVTLTLYLPFIKLYTHGVEDADYVNLYLPILFVLISLLTVMRTPMLFTINYAGHFKLTTPQTIIETIINLIVSLIGVRFWGIYGVLLGTIVALIYRTNDIIIYANTRILKRKPVKTYLVYILDSVMFIILQYLFKTFGIEPNTWLQFALLGIFYTLISISIMIAAQSILFPNNARTLLVWLKSKGK